MKQTTYDTLARVIPFAIYMTFVALLELPSMVGGPAPSQELIISLYPVKIAVVTAALIYFRKSYTDFDWATLKNTKHTLFSVGIGLIVFIIWINLDLPFAIQGELSTYDPSSIHEGSVLIFMLVSRALGAAVCVPIMEELFWRSFLVRYLINKDFMQVGAGAFTTFSFIVTSVLFGLEHQLYLAGMIAGAAYNLVYWRTKSLSTCILSHGVTNVVLAGYVLLTRSWHFW